MPVGLNPDNKENSEAEQKGKNKSKEQGSMY